MDSFSPIQQYLWAFGTVLLLPLIWIMYRRGQRKVFPCFFVYLLIVLFKSEALQLIKPSYPAAYFYGYWIAEAITILVIFGVIYEIYRHILTSGTLPVDKATFFRINVGLLFVASMIALFTTHPEGAALMRVILVLSSAVRIMQVGLITVLASFTIFFGFYWTGQAFGIALGYGLFALAQLANTLVRASAGSVGDRVYVYISMLGYQCAVLIWLAYALKGKELVELEKVPENNTAVWYGALERLTK